MAYFIDKAAQVSRISVIMKIGNISLDEKPAIVGVLTNITPSLARNSTTDIFEVRIDLFKNLDINNIRRELVLYRHLSRKPLIATIRNDKERGLRRNIGKLDEKSRLNIYKNIIKLVDAVDIEILSAKINREVILTAKNNGKTVIVSYHNFIKTPSLSRLEFILKKARALSPDIIKFSCRSNNIDDVVKLLLFINDHRSGNKFVAISMGNFGKISRIAAPLFGSCLIYAPTGKIVAPGQIDLKTLSEFAQKFYA